MDTPITSLSLRALLQHKDNYMAHFAKVNMGTCIHGMKLQHLG